MKLKFYPSIVCILLFQSCSAFLDEMNFDLFKDYDQCTPLISENSYYQQDSTNGSTTLVSEVINEGAYEIIANGYYLSTDSNGVLSENQIIVNSSLGEFSAEFNAILGQEYFFYPFSINECGMSKGKMQSFVANWYPPLPEVPCELNDNEIIDNGATSKIGKVYETLSPAFGKYQVSTSGGTLGLKFYFSEIPMNGEYHSTTAQYLESGTKKVMIILDYNNYRQVEEGTIYVSEVEDYIIISFCDIKYTWSIDSTEKLYSLKGQIKFKPNFK
ncbi:hypothetical protein [Sediminitomix flava]|uniref:Lipocalin-like protein n=1 Tax=Sediminitomix flava TaxID=379075 RepID=A0A315ZI70_SEDFL|nr:hypothetical protein [Sediminitomix flava]PWJ45002.1 hypothetical protein BC781_1011400 [Sediminitomix flava]